MLAKSIGGSNGQASKNSPASSKGKTQDQGKLWQCLICLKFLSSKYNLEVHTRYVHQEMKTQPLNIPTSDHSSKSNLCERVKLRHDVDKRNKCNQCSASFSNEDELAIHTQSVHGKKTYKCPECDIVFSAKCYLSRHVKSRHEPTTKTVSESKQSDKVSAAKSNPESSDMKSQGSFKCLNCDQKFVTQAKLDEHVKSSHQLKKAYDCIRCVKTFKTRQGLKDHVLSFHEKTKSFQCSTCYKFLSNKTNLNSHLESVHRGAKRRFGCNFCDKSFSKQIYRDKHIQCVHEQNRPQRYETSDKSLSSKGNPDQHVKKLLDKQSFNCQHCNKLFSRQSKLNIHVKVAHEKMKPSQNKFCEKSVDFKGSHPSHDETSRMSRPPIKLPSSQPAATMKEVAPSCLEEQVECDRCVEVFGTMADVRRHISEVHESARPFKCVFCHAGFFNASILKSHLEVTHHQ